MKIAIDIDEVIVGYVDKYMKFAGDKGFKRVNYKDIFSYDLWRVLGVDKKLFIELFDEYNSSENSNNIDFIEGAKEGVCFLRDEYDVCFITARSKSISKETRDFIFREFGVLGNKVFFGGDSINKGISKGDICRELGVGLIIEDNGECSLRYAEEGIIVLLLDKPWNYDFEHENICRCFSWDDILEKVKEIKNNG